MSDHFSGRSGGGLAGNLPGGVKLAAIALLIHQLMKHARAEGRTAPQQDEGGLGGLLGGLFGGGSPGTASGRDGGLGGLLGGLSGGGLGGLVGGLGGLLGGLRGQGLGEQVDSWVNPGPNRPVSTQELERSFDPQELDEAARRAGTDRGTLLQELSAMLPQAVDRMTPQGTLPQREEELGGGLGDLLAGLFGNEQRNEPRTR
jgi:uncharacterized protein YidB (DUF937 family)